MRQFLRAHQDYGITRSFVAPPIVLAAEVAHYKQIRRLEVIDEIPKSAAGKILRRVLRDSATT